MNNVILHGRLTKDPVVRYTSGESPMAICEVSIAVDRPGKKGEADYPTIVMFGKTAENAQAFVEKGCRIIVRGRIQTSKYEKDGRTIYTTKVVADQVQFIDFKKRDDAPKTEEKRDQEELPLFAMINEDVPF